MIILNPNWSDYNNGLIWTMLQLENDSTMSIYFQQFGRSWSQTGVVITPYCLDGAAPAKMVKQLPNIFGYNVDSNLKPTLNFYIDALEDKQRAFALVINSPNLFNFSCKKHMNPWLEDSQDPGIVINSGYLSLIALYTNDKWEKVLLSRQYYWK